MGNSMYTIRFLADASLRSTVKLENERWEVYDRIDSLFEFITQFAASGLVSARAPKNPHLFVSVVEAQVVCTGEDGTEGGFAAYQTGMYHIIIASQRPDGVSMKEFLDDVLPMHVFHEFKHFLQDVSGCLACTDKCEKEAEAFAEEMAKHWRQDKKIPFKVGM